MRFRPTLLLASLLSGCVPLRQEGLTGGPSSPAAVLQEDESLIVEIDTKKERILTGRSYAISPQGQRYSLQVKPHDYDIEQKSENNPIIHGPPN